MAEGEMGKLIIEIKRPDEATPERALALWKAGVKVHEMSEICHISLISCTLTPAFQRASARSGVASSGRLISMISLPISPSAISLNPFQGKVKWFDAVSGKMLKPPSEKTVKGLDKC